MVSTMCTGMAVVRAWSAMARDGLADPPSSVRKELVALGVVELLDYADRTQVALLDQVQEQRAPADEGLAALFASLDLS
jgi:hypothetical protein